MKILITESQFNIISNKNIILEYSQSLINKLIKKFKNETNDDEETILAHIKRFKEIKDNPNIQNKDITKYSWDELKDVIASNIKKRIKAGKINDAEPNGDVNLIYNQNKLRIYVGKTKNACIKYGNGYTFCISSRGRDSQYETYRYDQKGTPYFIFDDRKSSASEKVYDPDLHQFVKEFFHPDHLLVIFVFKTSIPKVYNYSVTDANNKPGKTKEYLKFEYIIDDYPRLKGLEKLFKPVSLSKFEYLSEKLYLNYKNKIDNILTNNDAFSSLIFYYDLFSLYDDIIKFYKNGFDVLKLKMVVDEKASEETKQIAKQLEDKHQKQLNKIYITNKKDNVKKDEILYTAYKTIFTQFIYQRQSINFIKFQIIELDSTPYMETLKKIINMLKEYKQKHAALLLKYKE